MHDRRERLVRRRATALIAFPAALVILLAPAASAAELNAAELEATVNEVTVQQGKSVSFELSLTASGLIRCTATPDNPATATFLTEYGLTALGGITAGAATAVGEFYADEFCNVTWDEDPAPQVLTMSVTADEETPLGSYGLRLRPRLRTPFGSGEQLRDDETTLITFVVVEPSGDNTPPAIACDGPLGTAGDNGWFVSDVAYECTASDDESGLADPGDAAFTLTTAGQGSVETDARDVADVEGNVATAGPFGPFDVDLTDPTVSITEPADGAVYLLGQDVALGTECDDDVSGIASCEVEGTLDTSSVGERTVTVTATDDAGRSTTASNSYSVVYDVDGPTVRGGKNGHPAGGALPMRWTIDQVTDASSFVRAVATVVDCDTGDALGPTEPVASPGKSTPKFKDGEFQLVLKTDPSWEGQCVAVGVELDDGTTHTTTLTFR